MIKQKRTITVEREKGCVVVTFHSSDSDTTRLVGQDNELDDLITQAKTELGIDSLCIKCDMEACKDIKGHRCCNCREEDIRCEECSDYGCEWTSYYDAEWALR